MHSVRVFAFLLSLLAPVFIPKAVFALTAEDCKNQIIGSIGCLPIYLGNIANGAFAFAGIAAVVLITLSGIRLLLSGGDPVKVEKAKKSMTYSIIGFVIILLSFTILKVVSVVTGAACINVGTYNSCA